MEEKNPIKLTTGFEELIKMRKKKTFIKIVAALALSLLLVGVVIFYGNYQKSKMICKHSDKECVTMMQKLFVKLVNAYNGIDEHVQYMNGKDEYKNLRQEMLIIQKNIFKFLSDRARRFPKEDVPEEVKLFLKAQQQ